MAGVTSFALGGNLCNLEDIEFRRLFDVDPSRAGPRTRVDSGPPGVVPGIGPFYPPGSLEDQTHIPQGLPEVAPGVVLLRQGHGAHVYMVHGLPGVDLTQALIAPLLSPCHVCALIIDDTAWKCKSIPDLARLLCGRLLGQVKAVQEFQEEPALPLVAVSGCSFGCVIAHEMVLQLEEAGIESKLVLFAQDACWPPASPWPAHADSPPSGKPERPKGCGWLGGEVETALLVARASGAVEWAEREVWRGHFRDSLDADDVLMRVFWEHARHFGMSYASFTNFITKAGRCSERLRTITAEYAPSKSFSGSVEFVMTRGAWADVPSLFGSD